MLRIYSLLIVLGAIAVEASPAFAIPSPDVIVNVFASAGQLLGLASVFFGAAFMGKGRRSGEKGRGANRWVLYGALLFLVLSVTGNILQYFASWDTAIRRLSVNLDRSSTEEGKKVGDVNLRTLSFSAQLTHPSGITADQFLAEFRQADFLTANHFIDVRTPEEVEMGYISGSVSVPQPDLKQSLSRLKATGKPLVLFCDSGNRSGEICTDLIAEGYPCRFVIGGFEKWVAENRPVENYTPPRSGQIRDIADYPNKANLLDTWEVEKIVAEEKPIFVDVRYPGDFELSHIPGAINIPLRRLTVEESIQTLSELPKQPVIAPCYDRRSCFFAMVLGLRLHRLGYDFRGRYTVPHEYIVPTKEKEWVTKWRQQNERTVLQMMSMPLVSAIEYMHAKLGSLELTIILMVLSLRLLVGPFVLKSDRDQYVLASMAGEIEALRERTSHDPGRHSRAIWNLYKKRNITPLTTLFGSLLQILLFVLAFMAVNVYSQNLGTREFLWLASPGALDASGMLPVGVALLFFAFMQSIGKKPGTGRTILHGIIGALLAALLWGMGAAVNFYLVCNLSFMLVQRYLTLRWLERSEPRRKDVSISLQTVVPLELAEYHKGAGNKAARLSKLMNAGLQVPRGFVVTDAAFESAAEPLNSEVKDQIAKEAKKLNGSRVAVRSSGLNEDSKHTSFAGVFESILHVSQSDLYASIDKVRSSFHSDRASAYIGNSSEKGGVLVQEMIEAEYSGVMFTEHPKRSASILIELTSGTADKLVSGVVDASGFEYGKSSGRLLGKEQPPIALEPLVLLGRKIDAIFGGPQDIEWAFKAGRFYVLQSRDITVHSRTRSKTNTTSVIAESERARLLNIGAGAASDEILFRQNELSEILPRPTPLSFSFMSRLWSSGGSTDLACRSFGLPYNVHEDSEELLTTVYGALYINAREENRRQSSGPGMISSFKLSRSAESLEKDFQEVFLPDYLKKIRLQAAINLEHLKVPQLAELLKDTLDTFYTDTYFEVERINIAAEFYLKVAQKELQKRDLSPALFLSNFSPTVAYRALAMLPSVRTGKTPLSEFLYFYGHRSTCDYELAAPRFSENPAILEGFLVDVDHTEKKNESRDTLHLRDKFLDMTVERARRFQTLKEDAKHYAMHSIFEIRRILVELGRRFEIGEGIFMLALTEVERLCAERSSAPFVDLIQARSEDHAAFEGICLPSELTLQQLETMEFDYSGRPRVATFAAQVNGNGLKGLHVAGSKEVVGSARVLHSPEELASFANGEILVTRFTSPEWTPLFARAGGIVTEVGGWLSHAAILAREYDLTAVVGVRSALNQIKSGDRIKLNFDGTVEILSSEETRIAPQTEQTI